MKPSKVAVTTGGSVISAVLSFLPLSCCVFPVAFSFLGASGLAFAMELMPYRPHFIALTVVFLGGAPATPSGTPGRYTVESDFEMRGKWNFGATFGNNQRVMFPINVQ